MYTSFDFLVHYDRFAPIGRPSSRLSSGAMETMKTHIDIDAQLLTQAMKLGGHRTKREAVEAALRRYVQWRARQELLELRGKIEWEGDLDQMRGRVHPAGKR